MFALWQSSHVLCILKGAANTPVLLPSNAQCPSAQDPVTRRDRETDPFWTDRAQDMSVAFPDPLSFGIVSTFRNLALAHQRGIPFLCVGFSGEGYL